MIKIDINFDDIEKFIHNKKIVDFIKNKFYRMSYKSSSMLVKLLLQNTQIIKASYLTNKPKTLMRDNLSFFNDKEELLEDKVKTLKEELMNFIVQNERELKFFYELEDEKKLQTKEFCFEVDETTNFEDVKRKICEEMGDICFKHNFEESKIPKSTPKSIFTLQRCDIQILTMGIKFDYPIQYKYLCTECGHEDRRLAVDVQSTNDKIKCEGMITVGDKLKRCNTVLNPIPDATTTKNAYVYDVTYEEKKDNLIASAFSFIHLVPGYYECVLFKFSSTNKKEQYFIVDVKPFINNELVLPKKVDGINYLYTLQQSFDNYIKQQTGLNIWGLFPVKVALIIQTILNSLGFNLVGNIQIIGDSSTGKTTVLKYYSYLLNSQLNLSTNGNSISIPALRGTIGSILFLGKEQKVFIPGFLGTHKSIHIDEAGTNRQIIEDMKTFLLEENYGYNKAGGSSAFYKRTAHLNISENLNYVHLGIYRGGIKKIYKDNDMIIDGEEKERWQEDWDLHQPLYTYENPYLFNAIRIKREEFEKKQTFWIDGYELAVHQRFPFYFYLVKEKHNSELGEVVKDNISKTTISENLQLIKVLNTESINNFINSLYIYKTNSEEDKQAFNKVDEILLQYGIEADVRTKAFYYLLLRLSRIVNMRMDVNEEDYDLIRWFIEKTNCKLDVADTNSYNINGPQKWQKIQERQILIEDKLKKVDVFGLPEGEFDA